MLYRRPDLLKRAVYGATASYKNGPPDANSIDTMILATCAGEQRVATLFSYLDSRLQSSNRITIFKSLVVIHFLIRYGESKVVLQHLMKHPEVLRAVESYSDDDLQSHNLMTYTYYLMARVKSFSLCHIDLMRKDEDVQGTGGGLFREIRRVQNMISVLLRCGILVSEPQSPIAILAFRLLATDLLELFRIVQDNMITLLENFFTLSQADAQEAGYLYRTFDEQTIELVSYMMVARNYEPVTGFEVPPLQHIPTGFSAQLDKYLDEKHEGGLPTPGNLFDPFSSQEDLIDCNIVGEESIPA